MQRIRLTRVQLSCYSRQFIFKSHTCLFFSPIKCDQILLLIMTDLFVFFMNDLLDESYQINGSNKVSGFNMSPQPPYSNPMRIIVASLPGNGNINLCNYCWNSWTQIQLGIIDTNFVLFFFIIILFRVSLHESIEVGYMNYFYTIELK